MKKESENQQWEIKRLAFLNNIEDDKENRVNKIPFKKPLEDITFSKNNFS